MPQKRAIFKKRLTALFVAKAQAQGRPYIVWDQDQKGLALRVLASGNRSFILVYRHHKRSRWMTLGDVRAIGLADARKLAATVMLQVIQGVDPQAARKAQRGADTFEELAAQYASTRRREINRGDRPTGSSPGICSHDGAS